MEWVQPDGGIGGARAARSRVSGVLVRCSVEGNEKAIRRVDSKIRSALEGRVSPRSEFDRQMGHVVSAISALEECPVWASSGESVNPLAPSGWVESTREFEAFAVLAAPAVLATRDDSSPVSG